MFESVSRRLCAIVALAGILLWLAPSRAHAQETTPASPRFEVTAGGAFYVWLIGELAVGSPSLDLLITTNLTRHLAVEVGADASAFRPVLRGYYRLQGRYSLPKSTPTSSFFVTFGLAGIFERFSLPAQEYENPDGSRLVYAAGAFGRLGTPLGNLGVGYARQVASRAAIRVDAQIFAGVDHDAVGVLRTSAGVTIPIGRYPALSTGGRP